ncbi:MAG: hypothetical protein H0V31_00880 [Acidobacteria bacterium]|nr:hypothetical protein [Acidobacteriota bacterium]
MFLSLILILLVAFGSLSLTYLFTADEPLMWRLCAGNVIGQVVFGLVCFVIACLFGFTTATISFSLLTCLLPLILFGRKDTRQKFSADWQAAKQNLEGADFSKFLRFAYYAAFFVLFYFFFERALLETKDGIFTGASNNLGDLPFHLGTIFSFTDGQNFPPENPSFAGVKFTYPFMADLIAASFVKMGAAVRDAMFVQNVFLAFSLLVILERFTFKLTNNRLAGKIAPLLLFFSGGLGFLWFFKDTSQTTKGFFEFIWNLPRDYTIGENFRWGNSLITLFITQRSLLLGMPLTLIVLQKIWELFATENTEKKQRENPFSIFHFPFSIFLIGLLAGTLPLIHAHSLFVLFVVSAFLFFFNLDKWREWLAFGVGVGVIAVPELLWAMTGSATRTSEFIDWHFGWDLREMNFLWFWLINTGIVIPFVVLGIYLICFPQSRKDTKEENKIEDQRPKTKNQLLFYIPFIFLFIIANAVKLAPWEWDNIKVLIYWFVGSIPFIAFALAWLWKKDNFFKLAAAGCLLALTLAGALDVWRVTSGAINYKVFDADAIKIAEQIKQKTAPDALFLNAPTYNTAVVLVGRRSLMRYTGHLASHGIDFREREADLKKIYEGADTADAFLQKYEIDYVLISPEERSYFQTNNLQFNENFFQKFPIVAEVGQYRIYKIKN